MVLKALSELAQAMRELARPETYARGSALQERAQAAPQTSRSTASTLARLIVRLTLTVERVSSLPSLCQSPKAF